MRLLGRGLMTVLLIAGGWASLGWSAGALPPAGLPAESIGVQTPRLGGTILALALTGAPGSPDLVSIRPDGTGRRLLMRGVGSASYSPDGAWIAFSQSGDIFVMPALGGPARRIVGGPHYSGDPTWSPNGRQVAFASAGDIFRATLDSGESAVRLTSDALDAAVACRQPAPVRVFFGKPAWHPQGRTIAVEATCSTGEEDAEPTGAYLAPLGGRLTRTFPRLGFGDAQWSPDGALLAFRDSSGDAHVDLSPIYLMRADGTGLRKLTPLRDQLDERNDAWFPVWAPHGEFIAYRRGAFSEELWITDVAGTRRWRVPGTHDLVPQDWQSGPGLRATGVQARAAR